jgi:hypothetical protein
MRAPAKPNLAKISDPLWWEGERMPNVLDAEPIRAFARRAGGKITVERVAARFERLAFDCLLSETRNFRPARPAELAHAPDWAQRALARGEEICVFVLSRASGTRLRTIARRLADACAIAATDLAERPRDALAIAAARAFLDKVDRANLDTIARKALFFARLRAAWIEDRDAEPLCAVQHVPATHARLWRRITSITELRAVGRQFGNCLARVTHVSRYVAQLRDATAQFWALHDWDGQPLIIAMAPAPRATCFYEVRGPRNTRIDADNPDLTLLAEALAIVPPPPAPTPIPLALSLPQARTQVARAIAARARAPLRRRVAPP